MKVLVITGMLAMGSNGPKSLSRVLEPPGPRFASLPAVPEGTGKEIVAKKFFGFTYFHGPSAARPHGWLLPTRSGKVSYFGHCKSRGVTVKDVSDITSVSPRCQYLDVSTTPARRADGMKQAFGMSWGR